MSLGRILKIVILFCFIACGLKLPGQIPGMKVYTQLDGYPGTIGYVMNQDEKGFLWIGTDNGAVVFDGKRFKVIDDRHGLIDKEILVAVPTKGGRVVFSPLLNNLSYYENGKVATSLQDKRLGLINNKTLNHAYKDAITGNVWVADNSAKANVMAITDDSIWVDKIDLRCDFYILGVYNNNFYLQIPGEKSAVFGVYNANVDRFDTLHKSNEKYDLGTISHDGHFLLAHAEQTKMLEAFEISSNQRVKKLWQYPIKNTIKQSIIDRNNHLWVTYESGGVEYYGLVNGKRATNPLLFLEDVIIDHVFTDKDNNKWFTTKDKGLFFISEKHWDNALLVKKLNLPAHLPLCVAGDSFGRIYIGYNKPLVSIIEKGGTKKINLHPNNFGQGVRIIKDFGNNMCFVGNSVLNFYKSEKNSLTPLYNYYAAGQSIKDVQSFGYKIIVATHVGINIINPADKILNIALPQFYVSRTTAVCVVADNVTLIGSPNGLFKKIGLHGTPARIADTLLGRAHITNIAKAQHGYVLIGTSVKGLFCYHIATGKIKPVGKHKMPGTSYIRQIYMQNDTFCWLATDRGVFRIRFDANLYEKEIEHYSFFDGLPSANTLGLYVQHDTLYVATAAGVGILSLKSVKHSSPPPIGWITSAQVGDSIYYFPQVLQLNHLQNDVQVSLSAISYESIGNIKYRYKLEGLSDNWIETESPDISFSGLAPGNYRLVVSAVNFKGIKSKQMLVLPIIIIPAFWQTTWFRWVMWGLAALVFFLIIFRIVVRKKNEQYRKIQQKRRLAELELEAIKAQINPHFIYNCLNSIQYFSYKNDYEPVNRYLDLFAKLIRQTMQFSQETFITLNEEVDYLNNYLALEKIRFKEKLVYHLQVQESIAGGTLIPSMMVQPYIENALKHGIAKLNQPGEVWLFVSQTQEGWLKIIIEDNGPGLVQQPKVAEKNKLGLRLAGSRAATYNQLFGLNIRITVKARNDGKGLENGVQVELLIPPITHDNTKF